MVDEVARRIDITLERQRLLIVRRRIAVAARCAACDARSVFVTPEDAARRSGVSTRQIYRWIEDGRLHAVERPEHLVLVCTLSLEGAGQNGFRS